MTQLNLVSLCTLAMLTSAISMHATRADVLKQIPGAEYFTVEGEDFDTQDGGGFIIVSVDDPFETAFGSENLPPDSNASRGKALYHDNGDDTARWQLQFSTPGEYFLYYHFSVFEKNCTDRDPLEYGCEDSFFLALDFGEEPEQAGRSDLEDRQGHNDPFEDPPFWEGNFHWQTANWEDDSHASYVVSAADVGQVLEFNIASRESGSTLDAMVFSLDPFLETSDDFRDDLDDLLNGPGGDALQAGDADQDFDFDQLDLVKVQISAAYLSGQAATWGDGDWDGAPGGSQGSPPAGNGQFDQLDIISALAPGHYLTGPYNALTPGGGTAGDGQTSIVYNPGNGELSLDAPAGVELTSINVDSAAGIFTGEAAQNLGGSFDNDADSNIFKATFGSSFASLSFGNVAQAGLSEEFVLNDLSVVGSLAGGGDLGNVDLVYVPEPTTALLLAVGLTIGLLRFRLANR